MTRLLNVGLASILGCALVVLGGCSDDETQPPVTPTGSGGVGAQGGGAAGGVGGSVGGGGTGGGTAGGFAIDDTVVSWHQPALSASVHFAPHDELEPYVLEQLGAAQSSLHLAFFNLRLEEVRDLLVQKHQAGLDVHVVLDKKQQDLSYNTMGAELRAAGVTVTEVENTSAANATMHDKFTVIDGHRVLTGSANYSLTALNISDEDLLTFDDTELGARYELEFAELVAGGNDATAPYGAGEPMQAWWGTEDSIYGIVETELAGAQTSALVAMFDMNTTDIVQAVIDAHTRGVTVVVVLDADQAGEPGADADETLAAAGVSVILADNTGSNYAEMHSKFLVVDHQRVTMGSYNWTNMGSYHNDENIVVVDDEHLAARVEGKLAQLLNDYATVSPTSLGLVEGPQQVTFRVTNVTLDPGVELTIQSEGGGPFSNRTPLSTMALTSDVSAGTRIEYRYAIVRDSTVLVEESDTHSFTVPYASGPFEVVDAFEP